jgi:hypothetical protein
MNTAHADDARKPDAIASCQRSPGLSDHASSHGSIPACLSLCASLLTSSLSALWCERKTSNRGVW